MARKHGFFRPHVAGLSGIYSTTLREGVGGLASINAIFAKATKSLWLTADPASRLKTTDSGSTPVAAAGDAVGRWDKTSGTIADVRQATAGNRPLYGESFVQGDMTDDYLVAAGEGGATTPFYLAASIMHRHNGAASQVLLGDRSGNTGRLCQIASTDKLQMVCGNGSSLVGATSIATLTPGQDYILEFWYDGTTEYGSIDGATPITATVALAAGTAALNILGNGVSGPMGGRLYDWVLSQGYAPTTDERTALRADLAARRDRLNALSDTPRYYVDSVAGNDSNDGLNAAAAKATWSDTDADYTIEANDVIGFKKDGEWRERVAPGVNNTKVVAYGSGTNRPVIRGDDIIPNVNFTATVGRTNIKQVDLTVETDAAASEWPAVWVDGTRLVWGTDLDTLDATPGAFWHDTVTDDSTITVYIHSTGSTDPATDGKVYEAAVREIGIDTWGIENAVIQDMEAIRPYTSYGAIAVGKFGRSINNKSHEGNTHALFLREGAYVSGGSSGDCYNHTTAPTIGIAFENSADTTLAGVTIEDHEFFQSTYLQDIYGMYMHTSAGGKFDFLHLNRCVFTKIGSPFAAANCAELLAVDPEVDEFLRIFQAVADLTEVRGLRFTGAKTGAYLGISGAAGVSVIVDDAVGTFDTTGNLWSAHNNTDFTLRNSTLTGMNQVLRGAGTGQRWTCQNNVFVPAGRMYTIYDLPADFLSVEGHVFGGNSFGGATGNFKIGGVVVATTLAEWQNLTGLDMDSEA